MYEGAFRQLDRNGDGFVEPIEVKEVLDRAGLPDPPNDMRRIYTLVDISQRGRLNFAEFACAMFIAFSHAKQGVPLPAELPEELKKIATSNISAAPVEVPSAQPPPAAAQSSIEQLQGRLSDLQQAVVPPVDGPQGLNATLPDRVENSPAASAVPAFFESSTLAADPFDQAMSVKEI